MKIIHPFDLIKIADDWFPSLKKSEPEDVPSFEGQIRTGKPHVGVAYWKVARAGRNSPYAFDKGKQTLVWQYDRPTRTEHDKKLAFYKTIQYGKDPVDNQLFQSFVDHVSNDPTRHVVKSFPGESHPRARHVINMLEKPHEGHEVHFITNFGNRYLVFQAIRHGESDVKKDHYKAERWVWDGKNLFKHEAIKDVPFPKYSKAPSLKDFFS